MYETSIKQVQPLSKVTNSSVFDIKPRLADGRSTSRIASIRKIGNDVTVEIDGLFPIIFYRARPDCILPVDCFVARKAVPISCSTATISAGELSNHSKDAIARYVTIQFAWKHTTVSGTRGLKLVDLRDNEVIAYYQLCKTKWNYWAKLRVLGSGLQLVPLIVATILALKYGKLLRSSSVQSVDSTDLTHTLGITQKCQQQHQQRDQQL